LHNSYEFIAGDPLDAKKLRESDDLQNQMAKLLVRWHQLDLYGQYEDLDLNDGCKVFF
jgi:hypothetical protein